MLFLCVTHAKCVQQTERVVSEVRLSTALLALSWNPGIINMLAACMQDGSAAVYEFKNNSFEISSIPPEAYATLVSIHFHV